MVEVKLDRIKLGSKIYKRSLVGRGQVDRIRLEMKINAVFTSILNPGVIGTTFEVKLLKIGYVLEDWRVF